MNTTATGVNLNSSATLSEMQAQLEELTTKAVQTYRRYMSVSEGLEKYNLNNELSVYEMQIRFLEAQIEVLEAKQN